MLKQYLLVGKKICGPAHKWRLSLQRASKDGWVTVGGAGRWWRWKLSESPVMCSGSAGGDETERAWAENPVTMDGEHECVTKTILKIVKLYCQCWILLCHPETFYIQFLNSLLESIRYFFLHQHFSLIRICGVAKVSRYPSK